MELAPSPKSGIGLALYRYFRHANPVRLARPEIIWLAAAIVAGGMVAPVLLMWGLSRMPASGASLLLNAEGVFTVLLAWLVFRENFDRRIALGMVLIVSGALVLSWPGEARWGDALPALAVLGACLAWAADNNFTRKVSLGDATFIAMAKGLVAGATNLVLALIAGAAMPSPMIVLLAAVLGFVSYGVSLAMFVVALRERGTARSSAYFSTAPFAGALIAVAFLGESVTLQLAAAGVLMAVGIVLHLSERHEHAHVHGPMEHEHEHTHDSQNLHHRHGHATPVPSGTRHTHLHRHESQTHAHAHYPDAHHEHHH